MAVWIGLRSKEDILYGLIETYQYMNKVDHQIYSSWDLHFYDNKKGLRKGMLRRKRENPNIVQMTFEIGISELIQRSQMETVIPKEINVDDDNLRFLNKPNKEFNG